jgi:hypothetical protein
MMIFTHRLLYHTALTLVSALVFMGGQVSTVFIKISFLSKSNTPATTVKFVTVPVNSQISQKYFNASGTFDGTYTKSEPVESLAFIVTNHLQF